jgi:lysophospholipase L1-like esterase
MNASSLRCARHGRKGRLRLGLRFLVGILSAVVLLAVAGLIFAPSVRAAPATPIRYQQDNRALLYHGVWSYPSNPSASGGSFAFANASGASVTVRFTGTSLVWIAKKSSIYGIAHVTLDRGEQETVDLYSASTQWRQPVWSTGPLGEGPHTVVIAWTGEKNAASANTYINVDAFDVAGSLVATTSTRYQQGDVRFLYQGIWSTSSNLLASGGTFRFANSPGAGVTIRFTGTYLGWIAKKSATYGEAEVSVDGGDPHTVDLYSARTQWRQPVWDTGALDYGPHIVRIAWTGGKNAASGDTNISVDAFDVVGTVATAPTRYQQSDARLWYEGLWTDSNAASASGGRYTFARFGDDLVTATFTGTRLDLIAKTGPNFGLARVSVDGGDSHTVDLYSPSVCWLQRVWSTGTLAAGTHTVTIEATGHKNERSTDTAVDVDALDVNGRLETGARQTVAGLIVFDGNSLTFGTGSTPGNDYPSRVMQALTGGPWVAHNVAVGGQSTAAMIADAASQIDILRSASYSHNIVLCFTGSVDRWADGNAAREAKLKAYCTARRAAGFKVVVLTLTSYAGENWPGTTRAEFNDWVRANYTSFADAVADVAADPKVGGPAAYANRTYFTDGIHLTDAGYAVVAGIVKQVLETLL